MSRVGKQPIAIPDDVNVSLQGNFIEVKGSKGTLSREINALVTVTQESGSISFGVHKDEDWKFAGTERALVNNMVIGVSQGFNKKLELIGVGYRAQMKGSVLNLNLGYSHDINFPVPEGLNIETPSQTEVVISGMDKSLVGQAAAKVRSYRPPEPYKGKGVKYADEHIRRKEVKKK